MQTHAGEIFYIDTNGDLITDKKNIYPGIFNSLARVCVPLFIMISGYLLLPMKTDYKTFLKKRFTRISFPFIAFCIFYDIYFFILGDIDIKTMFINIPKIFINYGTKIGHLWYIYMIMGVYLFIPIITPWIQTAKKEHFYYCITYYSLFNLGGIYMNDDKNNLDTDSNDNNINSFIQKYGGAIIGAIVAVLLCFTQLYKLVIVVVVIVAGILLGNYIQKNKDEVKEKLKELIDKF